MIDEAIETYLKALVVSAYPAVTESQIFFNYPEALFDQGLGISGKPARVIGSETLTVQMHVDENIKIERELFQKKLLRTKPLTLDGKTVRMVLKKIIQKDFIKITNLQGAVFVFNFRYEIN